MESLNPLDIIIKKRNGGTLTREEIEIFVNRSKFTDTQIGAMLMAIYQQKLNKEEVTYLTRAMLESGDILRWPDSWKGKVIDKHSTGGVGDKVSLVLAPALAALGFKVPMISGRGLEHTGGTIDKLESIPGYNPFQTPAAMVTILDKVGCCIVAQSDTIAPADKKLYPSRDATGTVCELGLITGSIMSKKLAESLDALILDIKCGRAAFMETRDQAKELAEKMVQVGEAYGVRTVALVTEMDRPIGNMVGNALEVVEAVETLQGKGSLELKKLVKDLGGLLLETAGHVSSVKEGAQLIENCIQDKTALDKFLDMLTAQGVEPDKAAKLCETGSDPFTVLPKAKFQTTIKSLKSGFVRDIEAMVCAKFANKLGAGQPGPGESINPAVGLQLHVCMGNMVKQGDPLVTIHHDTEVTEDEKDALTAAFEIINLKPNHSRRLYSVSKDGIKGSE